MLTTIRIAIVDDHADFRKALRSQLERDKTLDVIGEADNGLDAITLVKDFRPEVVLMDLNLPVADGFDATSVITEEYPATKVIVLSMHTLDDVRERALEAGASNFLSKDCSPKGIVTAIRNCSQLLRAQSV